MNNKTKALKVMEELTFSKEEKAKIDEELYWYFYNSSGYRNINGGFCNTKILSIKKNEKGIVQVKVEVECGKDDTGDGEQVKYKDKFDICLISNEKGIKIINN